MMMLDYWVAARLGKVWLRLRPGPGTALAGAPAVADSVARGEQVPAGQLLRAQEFGNRVWWRFGFCSLLLNFPLLGVVAAVNPGSGTAGLNVAVGISAFLVLLAAIGLAQFMALWLRSNRTRRFVLRHPGDSVTLLPSDHPGAPHQSDFWLAAAVAVALLAIAFFASGSA